MPLTTLPEDLLLEITRYLSSDALLAFSQTFQTALTLSQTSVLWWCHAITEIASYVGEIKTLNEYTAIDLRTAVLKAHRTWVSFQAPGARRESSFRTPIEDNRYEGVIPSGIPFYFSLGTFGEDRQTCLVCRDLGNGQVIGSHNIPSTDGQRFETKCLAVFAIDQQTVLVAILSQGRHSWYSPTLHVVEARIRLQGEDVPSLRAEFRGALTVQCPRDWTPGDGSKISIRLPKSFHIYRDTIYWVQDVINIASKNTLVSPLITVLKHDKSFRPTEVATGYQFSRWTCGADQDLYTIGATLAANHIIIITNYVAPRAFVVPLSTILSERFDPVYLNKLVSKPCFPLPQPIDGPLFSGIRIEFDSEIESTSFPLSSILNSPSTVGYKLRAAVIAKPSNSARTMTQVWWYTIYMHCVPTGSPTAFLHIIRPEKGTNYLSYISRCGLTRGLLWCATLGPDSVLFLERTGRGHWPILRSSSTEVELFDALSGVACAFSDSLCDQAPCMSVSWFKGKIHAPKSRPTEKSRLELGH